MPAKKKETKPRSQMRARNYAKWEKLFKPILNPNKSDENEECILFDLDGEDGKFVSAVDIHHVWTAVDYEGQSYLVAGRAFVNRWALVVTVKAWEDKDDLVKF